jgi:hypothetical protein
VLVFILYSIDIVLSQYEHHTIKRVDLDEMDGDVVRRLKHILKPKNPSQRIEEK